MLIIHALYNNNSLSLKDSSDLFDINFNGSECYNRLAVEFHTIKFIKLKISKNERNY